MKNKFYLLAETAGTARLDVIALHATKLETAAKEMATLQNAAQITDALLLAEDELQSLHFKIENALEMKGNCHWHRDDVLSKHKDMTPQQADQWLMLNEKQIQESCIQAGWSVIESV